MARPKTAKSSTTKAKVPKLPVETAETIPVRVGASNSSVTLDASLTATAPIISRTAKTLQPLSDDSAETQPTLDESSTYDTDHQQGTTDDRATSGQPVPLVQDDTKYKSTPPISEAEKPEDTMSDPEDATQDQAEASAESDAARKKAADDKRSAELEALIDSGQYFVPINAIRRRRSRALLIVALAIFLLALITIDIMADLELIHLPQSLPQTDLLGRQ